MFTDGDTGTGAATAEPAAPADSSETQHAQGGGAETGKTADEGFKPITSEADLAAWKEKIRREAVAEGRKAAKEDLRREAETNAAKEKGEYKEIADRLEAELETLRDELAQRDRAELRRTIAAKHNLPESLAIRLHGETEAELDADAKDLAKLVQRKAVDTEAGKNGKTSSGPTERPAPPPPDPNKPAYTFDGRKKVPWPARPQ